ncbi:MAG: phosphoglycerate mutase, partial [candidate division WOR-3 bacterium]
QSGELCARANFATVDKEGTIIDRRAKIGDKRMDTAECAELCTRLQNAIPEIEEVKVQIKPGMNHRFVVVFSGANLKEEITDSDPGKEGKKPLEVKPLVPEAEKTAQIVNRFIQLCAKELSQRKRANYVLLRGFSLPPKLPPFSERYKLRSACIAGYPMYKGLARLLGMNVLECAPNWEDEVSEVEKNKEKYDFFLLHFKEFDQAGEDGNFELKVELLEHFDEKIIPKVIKMGFDVICITGDHSTPAVLRAHSWHPVPLLIHSPYVRPNERAEEFSERACQEGSLGVIFGQELMPLLLANALRLGKFGA